MLQLLQIRKLSQYIVLCSSFVAVTYAVHSSPPKKRVNKVCQRVTQSDVLSSDTSCLKTPSRKTVVSQKSRTKQVPDVLDGSSSDDTPP
jgi:hypothetical protein